MDGLHIMILCNAGGIVLEDSLLITQQGHVLLSVQELKNYLLMKLPMNVLVNVLLGIMVID